eukprot:g22542.t1
MYCRAVCKAPELGVKLTDGQASLASEQVERRKNVQDFRLAQHEKMQRSQAAKELAKKAGEQHWQVTLGCSTMTGAQDTSCNLRQGVQEKKFKLLEKDLDFEKEMIRRDQLRRGLKG